MVLRQLQVQWKIQYDLVERSSREFEARSLAATVIYFNPLILLRLPDRCIFQWKNARSTSLIECLEEDMYFALFRLATEINVIQRGVFIEITSVMKICLTCAY